MLLQGGCAMPLLRVSPHNLSLTRASPITVVSSRPLPMNLRCAIMWAPLLKEFLLKSALQHTASVDPHFVWPVCEAWAEPLLRHTLALLEPQSLSQQPCLG